jgi:hypothetical protein
MFGRMAVTGNHAPVIRSDANLVAARQALKIHRDFRDAATIWIAAGIERSQVLGGHAVRTQQRAHRTGTVAAVLTGDRMRGQIFRLRHHYRAAEVRGKPCRVAQMIGVIVRCDDPAERLTGQSRGNVNLPELARCRIAVTAIDLRPSTSITEEPQVDVIERERQGHAQPMNAGRDLAHHAGGGRVGAWIAEDGWQRGVQCRPARTAASGAVFVRRSIVIESLRPVKFAIGEDGLRPGICLVVSWPRIRFRRSDSAQCHRIRIRPPSASPSSRRNSR